MYSCPAVAAIADHTPVIFSDESQGTGLALLRVLVSDMSTQQGDQCLRSIAPTWVIDCVFKVCRSWPPRQWIVCLLWVWDGHDMHAACLAGHLQDKGGAQAELCIEPAPGRDLAPRAAARVRYRLTRSGECSVVVTYQGHVVQHNLGHAHVARSNRLSAGRVLRVKRIARYISDKLNNVPDAEEVTKRCQVEGAAPEDVLELLCNDQVRTGSLGVRIALERNNASRGDERRESAWPTVATWS
jgi:hypothetical protein